MSRTVDGSVNMIQFLNLPRASIHYAPRCLNSVLFWNGSTCPKQ